MTLALDLGIDLVSGILGGGPDKQKVKERTARVKAAASLASQGDITAWHLLGAIGTPPVPAPAPIGEPYTPAIPMGWTAHDWGDDYDPIRKAARKYYDQYAPKFTVSSEGSPTTPGQGSPLSTAAPAPMNASLGVIGLVVLVAVVIGLLWKSTK